MGCAVGCLLWLAAAASASAADLTVEVRPRGGDGPLAGAAVCLGTAANPRQFGAFRSGADGRVVFRDLPRGTHLLTVSGEGYLGIGRVLESLTLDRVIQVELSRGGGGPLCEAPPVSGQGEIVSGLRIEGFRLDGGAAVTRDPEVSLDHRLEGDANQYRASEHADFAGASWQPYTSRPVFRLGDGRGEKRVYFQVRRYVAVGESSLETLSPVVSDRIRLE